MCYRDGAKMRRIPRLGIYFCDNDGYIMSLKEAEMNGLVRSEPVAAQQSH